MIVTTVFLHLGANVCVAAVPLYIDMRSIVFIWVGGVFKDHFALN